MGNYMAFYVTFWLISFLISGTLEAAASYKRPTTSAVNKALQKYILVCQLPDIPLMSTEIVARNEHIKEAASFLLLLNFMPRVLALIVTEYENEKFFSEYRQFFVERIEAFSWPKAKQLLGSKRLTISRTSPAQKTENRQPLQHEHCDNERLDNPLSYYRPCKTVTDTKWTTSLEVRPPKPGLRTIGIIPEKFGLYARSSNYRVMAFYLPKSQRIALVHLGNCYQPSIASKSKK